MRERNVMWYYHSFPNVIPLWKAGYSRVTHPSATKLKYQLTEVSILKSSVRLACVRHAASVHPEPGSNSLKILSKRPQAFKSFLELNRSWCLLTSYLLVLHKNYCCTWKYILKLIFKGFFLINRCLIFKVRRTRFVSAWILYHTAPQLSTLFFAFFIRFFQLLRVFCKRMDFVMVLMHCYGGSVLLRLVFYWVIGLLLFYYYTFGFVVFTFSVACGVLVWEPSQGRCGHRPLQVVWWYRAFSSGRTKFATTVLPVNLFDFWDGRPVPYGVDDDFCCFSDSHKGCPYDLFFQFVADDAHIVQKSYISLFACGESVRRDAEPYGF